ncbi:hypothetical protein J1N35_011520, partial [Gossypium stocksii]
KSLGILRSPPPMRSSQSRSNSRDSFHNYKGQQTEDCFSLKNAIKEAVKNGELKDFMAQDTSSSSQSS